MTGSRKYKVPCRWGEPLLPGKAMSCSPRDAVKLRPKVQSTRKSSLDTQAVGPSPSSAISVKPWSRHSVSVSCLQKRNGDTSDRRGEYFPCRHPTTSQMIPRTAPAHQVFPPAPAFPMASCEVMPEDSLQGLRALFLSHQSPIPIQTPCPSRNLTERTRTRAPAAFN